jgi:hypothetical protein
MLRVSLASSSFPVFVLGVSPSLLLYWAFTWQVGGAESLFGAILPAVPSLMLLLL